jgi:hypothetical protein
LGEEGTLFPLEFNGSIRVESRPERLTSAAGSVVLRETLFRLGMSRWLEEHLQDHRNPDLVKHPLVELVHTSLLLLAQGWRAQDDADFLRNDAALRISVSERRGISPLQEPSEPGAAPEGLASQPTLSRLMRGLSSEHNRTVLRDGLLEMAVRRDQGLHGDRPREMLTVDVDSIPVEVHGHQEKSEYNGHYKARIFHPLIATAAETGDLLDVRLRAGNAHTADGALSFIDELLDKVERACCRVAAVRIDAGFPEDELLSALERRQTPYVARIRNNAVLDRMADPYLKRPVGRPPAEPRTWYQELTYQARSWSRERRVVLVVQERPGELFLHHFWLITSWTAQEQPAEVLLEHYRDRGTAESLFGELMSTLAPALSSVARPKTHYQGAAPEKVYPSGDSFAINEVTLLLNALAYNLLHAVRSLMQVATRHGWRIKRLRNQVLRMPGRLVLHARRAVLVITGESAAYWQALQRGLRRLPPAPA